MDKGRNPHVIRTWAVDRIRQHHPMETLKPVVNPKRSARDAAPKRPVPQPGPKNG